jgi:transposase
VHFLDLACKSAQSNGLTEFLNVMKEGLPGARDNGVWRRNPERRGGPVTQYVGIDWAYRRAAWCAMSAGGAISGEGFTPADEDGLAKLVLQLGGDVKACVEMMSGAVWVRDQLRAAGWQVEGADARRVKGIAPLACKTDRVDARVLAELCRRDLVPALWIPSLEERELRERLRRRTHLVRLRTSAINRVYGLGTQWGLRLRAERLRHHDGLELLTRSGMPTVWQRSIHEALAVIELLDARITPLDQELAPIARADPDVALLVTIPGVGDLLALTIAAEIGDISRFPSARKLIGYAGMAPGVRQSGDRTTSGLPLSKAGSRTLRWAAVEAAQHGWRESNPWQQLYSELSKRSGGNDAKSAVARKILTAAWHILSLQQPFKPSRPRGGTRTVPASSPRVLAA